MTLAGDVFEAKAKLDAAEEWLIDALDLIYESDGWRDYTFDSYDDSLEVYGVREPVAADKLRHLGFRLVWQHPGSLRQCLAPDGLNCKCAPTVCEKEGA